MIDDLIHPDRWRSLFDAVYEMNTAEGHADFLTAVTVALSRLIPADVCVVHVLDRTEERLIYRMAPENPFTPDEMAHYAAHSDQFPFVPYYEKTGDNRARRLSDITDMTVWRQSEYYNKVLGRLGLAHALALPVNVSASTVAGLSFNRSTGDFTIEERDMLDAFGPHFRLTWHQHDDPWALQRDAVESTRQKLQGLTRRESDVLYWMTEGKQNREIATILGVSLSTVQEHVANLIRKLEQDNRHATTVFALRKILSR
jgi:DNA-binding CsgD family transcriptional regulator